MTLDICFSAPSLGIHLDQHLVEAVVRTLRYADLFDQAVTQRDLLRFLEVRAEPEETFRVLKAFDGYYWLERDGYYCLLGRADIIPLTQTRARMAEQAWVHALRWASICALVPFVRMIAVTGSLAMNNMAAVSDIDYLVVAAPGRVWTTRFWLVCIVRLARLFGQELCPNYLLSENALAIEDRTLFTARELVQMKPVVGARCYAKMMAKNAWVRAFLPAYDQYPSQVRPIRQGWISTTIRATLERICGMTIFDRFERWEMRRKIARLSQLPGAIPPHVILNADQCKGHFRATHRSLAERLAQDRA